VQTFVVIVKQPVSFRLTGRKLPEDFSEIILPKIPGDEFFKN
jgi:hypothetical protein